MTYRGSHEDCGAAECVKPRFHGTHHPLSCLALETRRGNSSHHDPSSLSVQQAYPLRPLTSYGREPS